MDATTTFACALLVGALAACGGPDAKGPAGASSGAPCGLTPEERAAPAVTGVEYVPPAPSAVAPAPSASTR